LQTQAEFTFAAGTRASTDGGIGVWMHQQLVTARLFAMAQSFDLAQSGQEGSRSDIGSPFSGGDAWPVDGAAAPQCEPSQRLIIS
jgi:hypothetical protein